MRSTMERKLSRTELIGLGMQVHTDEQWAVGREIFKEENR